MGDGGNRPSPPTINTAGFSLLEDEVDAEVAPLECAVKSDMVAFNMLWYVLRVRSLVQED